jgi:hypothetical protein
LALVNDQGEDVLDGRTVECTVHLC